MNPFIQTMPITSLDRLHSREENLKELGACVEASAHTVVMGVEGVGKSSLIDSFFNREYRIQKAIDGVLITEQKEFPQNIKNEEFYKFYYEIVIGSFQILLQCGEDGKAKYEMLHTGLSEKQDGKYTQEDFRKLMENVKDNGFRVVIVVDNFELFLSSKEVTAEHHENLLRTTDTTQYIIVTNYDLSENALPRELSASKYLMKFTTSIIVQGWSPEETKAYIDKSLVGEGFGFSDECIREIYQLSGGIPFLVKEAASYVYQSIKRGDGEVLNRDDVYNKKVVQTLLKHWCKLLLKEDVVALKNTPKTDQFDSTDAILRRLLQRGITKHPMEETPFGAIEKNTRKYVCCCQWLEQFIADDDKVNKAIAANPFLSIFKEDEKDEKAFRAADALAHLYETKEEEIRNLRKRLMGLPPGVEVHRRLSEQREKTQKECESIRKDLRDQIQWLRENTEAYAFKLRTKYPWLERL